MADLFKSLEGQPLDSTESLADVLAALPFNDAGLLPAIAQDAASGEVLMLAWMNRDAITETLNNGYACYYSRSRQRLWEKGETSGHRQKLLEFRFDCDGDAILMRVEQTGPACHTNRQNCFYLQVDADQVRVISEPR